jgi:hypothetical protein
LIAVNEANTNSGRDLPVMSTNDKTKTEMISAQNERRELVPGIIAGIAAAVCLFYLWYDLSDDLLSHGDRMITSTVISRAGAIVTPSEQPGDLSAPQAAPALKQGTIGRDMH